MRRAVRWMRLLAFRGCWTLVLAGLFLVGGPVLADQSSQWRVVDLQGSDNTRDIGGYEAQGGRLVRKGQIYRSRDLSKLNADDFRRLEALGIRTIIDLRHPQEVEWAPTRWQGASPPLVHALPIGRADSVWVTNQTRLLRSGTLNPKQSMRHYVDGYRALPTVGSKSYGKLFEIVSDSSNWPVLIHCSAGKDRTGVAVALIMEALGVERDAIMADYLLTNEVARTRERSAQLSKQIAGQRGATGSRMTARPPSAKAYFPFIGVTPEMLNAFYDGVAEEYGSMDAYLVQLGVDEAKREALIDALTE